MSSAEYYPFKVSLQGYTYIYICTNPVSKRDYQKAQLHTCYTSKETDSSIIQNLLTLIGIYIAVQNVYQHEITIAKAVLELLFTISKFTLEQLVWKVNLLLTLNIVALFDLVIFYSFLGSQKLQALGVIGRHEIIGNVLLI